MSDTALLIIDMFNDYQHADGDELAQNVAEILDPLQQLLAAARAHNGVEVVYVNDNHEDFSAGRQGIVDIALAGRYPELVRPLVPMDGNVFVTKVRHSVFYATALDYLRHYNVVVPADAVAHIDPELGKAALTMMQRNMDAEIVDSARCLPSSARHPV